MTRFAASAYHDHVNVKEYGAVGDGVTDDWAAFQAAHDGLSASGSYIGGRIVVPPGAYYLSQSWAISKRVLIDGAHAGDQVSTAAASLVFPQNTHGIRLYSNVDSPTGSGADRSRIRGLNISAQAKGSSGHGIWSTTVIKVEDCIVRSFKGHGIFIHGQTGTGATGIADAWYVGHTRIVSCDGDGLHVEGNDSQIGVALQVECSTNAGWGYYDNASYSNTYIACEAAGNTTGAYYNRNGTFVGGVYIGCYTETGTGSTTNLDANCVVFGGVIDVTTANALIPFTGGCAWHVPAGARHIFARNNAEIGRVETDNSLQNFSGYYASAGANDFTNIVGNLTTSKASTTSSNDRTRFQNPNGTVGSITTNGSATAYNTSSDYRLKQNDAPLRSGLDTILRLRPVAFTWKADGARGEGFIAHELQGVIPQAVTGEKDGAAMQGVDASKIVPHLVAAVQELYARLNK